MKELYLDDRDINEVWQEFNQLWWQQTEQDMSGLLKEMLEHFSHEELVRQTCLCVARRQGLMRALEMVYPWVAHQLCWVHKMWNVLGKVRKVDHESVKRGLRAIYEARSRKAALEAYLRWARRWRGRYPRAIRSVNLIEQSFREVRRRTRPITTFTNPDSCDRIIFGVISKLNMQWRRSPLKEFANKP